MIRFAHLAASAASVALAVFAVTPALAENLIANGSFEKPVVQDGGYSLFSNGQSIGRWTVVGASGNVAPVSGTFEQNGVKFPSKKGKQWLDLTGVSNTATGVEQQVKTARNAQYELTFYVGNVQGSIFGATSSVQVFVDGEPVMVAVNSKGGDVQNWKRFSTVITATKTRTTIRFINGDGPSDTHNGLDGVSLEAVVMD